MISSILKSLYLRAFIASTTLLQFGGITDCFANLGECITSAGTSILAAIVESIVALNAFLYDLALYTPHPKPSLTAWFTGSGLNQQWEVMHTAITQQSALLATIILFTQLVLVFFFSSLSPFLGSYERERIFRRWILAILGVWGWMYFAGAGLALAQALPRTVDCLPGDVTSSPLSGQSCSSGTPGAEAGNGDGTNYQNVDNVFLKFFTLFVVVVFQSGTLVTGILMYALRNFIILMYLYAMPVLIAFWPVNVGFMKPVSQQAKKWMGGFVPLLLFTVPNAFVLQVVDIINTPGGFSILSWVFPFPVDSGGFATALINSLLKILVPTVILVLPLYLFSGIATQAGQIAKDQAQVSGAMASGRGAGKGASQQRGSGYGTPQASGQYAEYSGMQGLADRVSEEDGKLSKGLAAADHIAPESVGSGNFEFSRNTAGWKATKATGKGAAKAAKMGKDSASAGYQKAKSAKNKRDKKDTLNDQGLDDDPLGGSTGIGEDAGGIDNDEVTPDVEPGGMEDLVDDNATVDQERITQGADPDVGEEDESIVDSAVSRFEDDDDESVLDDTDTGETKSETEAIGDFLSQNRKEMDGLEVTDTPDKEENNTYRRRLGLAPNADESDIENAAVEEWANAADNGNELEMLEANEAYRQLTGDTEQGMIDDPDLVESQYEEEMFEQPTRTESGIDPAEVDQMDEDRIRDELGLTEDGAKSAAAIEAARKSRSEMVEDNPGNSWDDKTEGTQKTAINKMANRLQSKAEDAEDTPKPLKPDEMLGDLDEDATVKSGHDDIKDETDDIADVDSTVTETRTDPEPADGAVPEGDNDNTVSGLDGDKTTAADTLDDEQSPETPGRGATGDDIIDAEYTKKDEDGGDEDGDEKGDEDKK